MEIINFVHLNFIICLVLLRHICFGIFFHFGHRLQATFWWGVTLSSYGEEQFGARCCHSSKARCVSGIQPHSLEGRLSGPGLSHQAPWSSWESSLKATVGEILRWLEDLKQVDYGTASDDSSEGWTQDYWHYYAAGFRVWAAARSVSHLGNLVAAKDPSKGPHRILKRKASGFRAIATMFGKFDGFLAITSFDKPQSNPI